MISIEKNTCSSTTIEGHLEHIIFTNPETHYTIARLKTTNPSARIVAVGYLVGVNLGEILKIKGTWQTHPKYGQQFKIFSYEVTLPGNVNGIRSYLQSGLIKGIGPSLAERLVATFGSRTLEIIENAPERLIEVQGIGDAKTDLIQSAWKEHRNLKKLMGFLQEMGVQTSFCAKIYQAYGPNAIDLIREDPYALAGDLDGPGFVIADTIAGKLGVEQDDPRRVWACIRYLILQNADDGHTFAELENLISRCENTFQISRLAIEKAIDEMVAAKVIVEETLKNGASNTAIYMREIYHAEAGLALRLNALLSVPLESASVDVARIAHEVHEKLAINLSAEQLQVLKDILSHRVVIITGGPGTGKTTLLRSISTIFENQGKHMLLGAPTGRAARRMAEVTRRKAGTIHRLLGYNFINGGFLRNRDNPLDADAVIIDEASMIDTILMYHLLDAIPVSSVLILVGDVSQLPSVGPGNVLSDMIDSARIPVFYLNKIYRQDMESTIVVNAHKVRQGEPPDCTNMSGIDGPGDYFFIEQSDPKRVADRILRLCRDELPGKFDLDPIHDIQVLTPMHKGTVGTINLNQMLQKSLNPQPDLMVGRGYSFKSGDKVMQLLNNYQKDVYNGDIGIICSIDRQKKEISVDYYGRTVSYAADEFDQMATAYAISVHKSQGSEYPAVIVPLVTQHYYMLERNLLYTAMTRAKKLVILIGTQKALQIALKNDKPHRRLSSLAAKLGDAGKAVTNLRIAKFRTTDVS
jgi:exodeoxyribonuclease V alpha subunit